MGNRPECDSEPFAECLPAYFPQTLRDAAQMRKLEARQGLSWAGDSVQYLHFLLEGELRLVHHHDDGGEVVLQTIVAGQMMAECSLCLSEYSCSAIAARTSRVAVLPVSLFNHLLREDNEFAVSWGLDLAARLRDMYLREKRLKLRNSRDRVLHYLSSIQSGSDGVCLDISVKSWALELGVSHENLYRTLASLECEGRLLRDGRRLRVVSTQPVATIITS